MASPEAYREAKQDAEALERDCGFSPRWIRFQISRKVLAGGWAVILQAVVGVFRPIRFDETNAYNGFDVQCKL